MWKSEKMIALYIVAGLIALVVLAWAIARKTVRSRVQMQKLLVDEPDINDWLIIFNWTPKILYFPTILFSLFASVLMFLQETEWPVFGGISPEFIGGIWFCLFLLNVLVEEYDITIKVILASLLTVGCFLLLLKLAGAIMWFLGLLSNLPLSINGMGYLLLALFGCFIILVSWLHGLFYYYTITPNYMNIQKGLTEAGEQVDRAEYTTRIDTSDFCERLLGFGKIIISFRDKDRAPRTVLVWRIQKKAWVLEVTRGKLAIDLPPQRSVTSPDVEPPEAEPEDSGDKGASDTPV